MLTNSNNVHAHSKVSYPLLHSYGMTVDFIIRQHRDSPPTGRRGALCQSFDTVLAAAEEVNPHPADQRSATEDLTTCQPRLSVEESDSHKVALQHVCEFNM
ncbi:hypothetical protein CgunFtcFv8_025751 [Champsocephalus gunnari]|uniref:Uncharacterized protein n=1 Tax=Champsocephalus gunnari TaxID=52237 RepID=A0AAN8CBC8_CHAGU|nr:hypothetical protein CgunFtcFv8_025751 [Champsocephalus gunnari]